MELEGKEVNITVRGSDPQYRRPSGVGERAPGCRYQATALPWGWPLLGFLGR